MLYDMTAVTTAYFCALWLKFDCRFSEFPNVSMERSENIKLLQAVTNN